MFKRFGVVLSAFALVLCLGFATGCTNGIAPAPDSGSESVSEVAEVSGTIAVWGEDGEGAVQSFTCDEGSTVLDVLQSTHDVVAEDSEYGPYVVTIDGYTPDETSGWIYTVNGESVPESAGEYEVSEGDEIVWELYVAE